MAPATVARYLRVQDRGEVHTAVHRLFGGMVHTR